MAVSVSYSSQSLHINLTLNIANASLIIFYGLTNDEKHKMGNALMNDLTRKSTFNLRFTYYIYHLRYPSKTNKNLKKKKRLIPYS